VLSLLLLIIAIVIAAVFLVRYLRTRPAGTSPSPTSLMVSPKMVILSASEGSLHRPNSTGEILRFAQDDISRLIS
jgi:hypothetical protein